MSCSSMAVAWSPISAAGTLIDPGEPVGETYARIAGHFGVELPARRLSDAFGLLVVDYDFDFNLGKEIYCVF